MKERILKECLKNAECTFYGEPKTRQKRVCLNGSQQHQFETGSTDELRTVDTRSTLGNCDSSI